MDGAIADVEQVQFFSESTCSGASLGQSLVTDFKTVGTQIVIPANQPVDLYISSPSSSECLFVERYVHSALEPSIPNLIE